MKLKTYFSLIIALSGLAAAGCVTTHETKGFQTNPSFKTSKGFPHSFAKEKDSNGIQKFFSSLAGKKSPKIPLNQQGVPLDTDATSLHSKGTLSPELLISLGKMGLDKGRYDSAASYFERALQMDPNNTEAQFGLSEAKSKVGDVQKAQQDLVNPLGSNMKTSQTRSAIQLVAFEEDASVTSGPDKISMESVEIPKPPETIMQPEIRIGKPSRQRVANPFFGTKKSADLKALTGEQVIEKKTPAKLSVVKPASQKTSLRLTDE